MRSIFLGTPSFGPASEAELIARAKARDEAALRAILKANTRRLFRIARGILRNDSEAEDVVQETYIRALTHLDGFRPSRRGCIVPVPAVACDIRYASARGHRSDHDGESRDLAGQRTQLDRKRGS